MMTFLWIVGVILAALLLGALLAHALPPFGPRGKAVASWFTHAPGLDIAVVYFTVLPLIGGWIAGLALYTGWWGGWAGLIAGVLAFVLGVMVWTVLHELAHIRSVRGPRIVKELNKRVGRVRNHAAVWTTALAVPVFSIIRLAEYVVYPPLTKLIQLPKYEHAEWVNISRQKFEGLVGHDLIWCLYCDWMTGVWSLGSEMLRNVESFWCPIRFQSDKKCANCVVDFPDIDNGWVRADGTMEDVAGLIRGKLSGGNHSWYGHPTRLTVEGNVPQELRPEARDDASSSETPPVS
jgi:hypothetical protein